MQSIDSHPTFATQTVARRQADFLAERREAAIAAHASGPAVHGARRGRLEQLAQRVRSAIGAAA